MRDARARIGSGDDLDGKHRAVLAAHAQLAAAEVAQDLPASLLGLFARVLPCAGALAARLEDLPHAVVGGDHHADGGIGRHDGTSSGLSSVAAIACSSES